jgi:UDP-N-acetylmuramoyl-L-alanyl-D-glutamate--2,6-diaminopimelate ligase
MKTKKQNKESMDLIHERLLGTVKLKDLVEREGGRVQGDDQAQVSGLVTDSRRVTPNSAFFALPGLRTNGNEYLQEALDRGAKVIISETEQLELPLGVTGVKVGVTGTNGKTTVSTLVRHLIERPGRPVGLIGTVRYHLGDREVPSFKTTPESADLYALLRSMLVAGCSEAVMEVSSHGIHQSRVASLQLEIAAFLNLTRDHLDYHENMESYFREKRKIFNGDNGSLPKVAVINGDCPYGRRLIEELPPHVQVLSFGLGEDNVFRAKNLNLQSTGSEFILEGPFGSMMVTSPLIGRYNVMNVLASFGILHALGHSVSDAVRKVGAFEGVDGRMESVDRGQNYKVVVDYAHTPDALRNALGMLKECTEGNLHLVFGCGGDRDKGKRLEMTRVACAGADRIWATADNPRTESQVKIFKDMRKGLAKGAKVSFVEDRRRAISLALDAAQEKDTVLIAGKGHETFQEVQYTAIPFDDRLVAGELISTKLLSV